MEAGSKRGGRRSVAVHFMVLALALVSGAAGGCASGTVPAGVSAGGRAELRSAAALDAEVDRVVHLLNRATYGVRPEDVEEVLRRGRAAWLEEQLHPDRIADPVLEARLEALKPKLTSSWLLRLIQVDDAIRSSVRLVEYSLPDPSPGQPEPVIGLGRVPVGTTETLRTLTIADAPGPSPFLDVGGEPFVSVAIGPSAAVDRLAAIKLERAVSTARQLEEVMTDFWFNHFNVYFGKGPAGLAIAEYERDAIRPHVFGRFEELLAATARHPAMLVYLDNFASTAPSPADSADAGGGLNENYARELLELHTLGVDGGYSQQDVIEVARAFTGWGIELDIVTPPVRLGVVLENGIYYAIDNVARRVPGQDPSVLHFAFRAELHDQGPKTVLGVELPAGRGMEDGLEVLRILAHHPSTARHLAGKLVQHFVADQPPPSLVDELAAVFLATGGDLREVTRTLFSSGEFHDPAFHRVKVKRPFEFVASALRVSGGAVENPQNVADRLGGFGHLPYFEPQPTGYPTEAGEWMNAAVLISRYAYARELAAGQTSSGVYVRPSEGLGDEIRAAALALLESRDADGFGADPQLAARLASLLIERVLPGLPAPDLHAALVADLLLPGPIASYQLLIRQLAIALASPDFQRY